MNKETAEQAIEALKELLPNVAGYNAGDFAGRPWITKAIQALARLESELAEPHTISVYVTGGVVDGICDIPEGVQVRVVDYDNTNTKDDAGNPCSIDIYETDAIPAKPENLS